jgi:hypothetical protein
MLLTNERISGRSPLMGSIGMAIDEAAGQCLWRKSQSSEVTALRITSGINYINRYPATREFVAHRN